MTATPDAPARYAGVQVLRFIAALLVVVTHATLYTHERLTDSQQVWRFGEFGVDVFFVISGFVMIVSSQSLMGRDDGWRAFAMRRLIRIVPLYWVATSTKLLTMLSGVGVVLHAQLGWNVPLSYLFLPSTNIDGQVHPLLGVGWTLTFEMFFYALFTVALLLRVDPMRFCGVLLTVIAAISLFRTEDWPAAATYFHPRVLYFLAGMIIGRYAINRIRRRAAVGLGCVGGLMVALVVGRQLLTNGDMAAWDHVLRPVTAIVLVLGVVLAEPTLTGRVPAPLVYLGAASYSLYLFHPLIAPAVPVALSIIGWRFAGVSITLAVIAAIFGSALIHQYLEKPITKSLQSRLPYVRLPRRQNLAR